MLLEMGFADAYAIAWEFVGNNDKVGPVNFERFLQNPMYSSLSPGKYTDDTQRSLANAKVLLDGNPFDPKAYVSSYIETYRNDKRDSHSRRYQRLLDTCISEPPELSDDSFNSNILRQASSNGSIMGVAPLGYLKNPADVALAAACQALSTHAAETIPFAQAIALKAHSFLYPKNDERYFEDLCARYISSKDLPAWNIRASGPVTMSASDTFKAVMRILNISTKNYTSLIREAINIGGDTDSVAAITIAIASCSQEYSNDIPSHLMEQFETEKTIKELKSYDTRLEEVLE